MVSSYPFSKIKKTKKINGVFVSISESARLHKPMNVTISWESPANLIGGGEIKRAVRGVLRYYCFVILQNATLLLFFLL